MKFKDTPLVLIACRRAVVGLLALVPLTMVQVVHATECLIASASSAVTELCPMSNGMALVKIGNQWGMIDKTGKVAVPPKFDSLRDSPFGVNDSVNRRLILAEKNEVYGFIDTRGNWVIKPSFSYSTGFSEGLAAVEQNGKVGYIDRSGKWVIKPQSRPAIGGPFKNGRAMVVGNGVGGKRIYSLIDKKGQVVKQFPANEEIDTDPNKYGLYKATVKFDRELRHIDSANQAPSQASNSRAYNEDIFIAPKNNQTNNGDQAPMGAVDMNGHWIIKPTFVEMSAFQQKIAIVKSQAVRKGSDESAQAEAKTGLIDTKGHFVVNPAYERIERDQRGNYRAFNDAINLVDLFGANGERLITFPCQDVRDTTFYSSTSQNWAVYQGCDQVWVVYDSKLIYNGSNHGDGEVNVHTTTEHLLLTIKGEGGTPLAFNLMDINGRVLLSNKQEPVAENGGIFLIANQKSSATTAKKLPIALIYHDYKSVKILTDDGRLVSNPEWVYDSAMLYFDQKDRLLEGPLPMSVSNGTDESIWGAIDSQGGWVIKPKYDKLTTFAHGLAYANLDRVPYIIDALGEQYSYPDLRQLERVSPLMLTGIDEDGKYAQFDIKSQSLKSSKTPENTQVSTPYYNGLASACLNQACGLIDMDGQWKVPPTNLSKIEPVLNESNPTPLVGWKTSIYQESKKTKHSGDLYGWLDADGKELLSVAYTEINFDQNSKVLNLTSNNSLKGAMTLDGKVFLKPEFSEVDNIGGGWYSVLPHEQYGLINAKGDWALAPDAKNAHIEVPAVATASLNDSALWWSEHVNEYGYEEQKLQETIFYDDNNKIKLRVAGITKNDHFSEGVISFKPRDAKSNDSLGIVDDKGRILGLYKADGIQSMVNGFSIYRSLDPNQSTNNVYDKRFGFYDERFGYISRDGKTLIPALFEHAMGFQESRAAVLQHGNIGMIDETGKLLMHSAWYCGREPMMIDGEGNILWPTDLPNVKECPKR